MLRTLTIQGLAVIERLELEFDSGLSVFSGETGAGKSILVGAIGLALGSRGSKDLIRHKAERAEITLECDLKDHPKLRDYLEQHELGSGESILLRRVLTRSASRAYINDTPASINTLREVGQQIIEIHGQQEHQRLLRREHQRQLLDGACKHAQALSELAECQRLWSEANDRAQMLDQDTEQRQQALTLLRFQVEELNELGLVEGEYEDMDAQQRTLAGADELRGLCSELIDTLYEKDTDSIYSHLAHAAEKVEQAAAIDPRLQAATEFLPNSLGQIEEVVPLLRDTLERIDLDPEQLAEIEQRLSTAHDLARKHQVPPQDLWTHTQELNEQFKRWQSPEYDAKALRERIQELEQTYRAQAESISARRRAQAEHIAKQTTEILHQLGMPHSQFEIEVTPHPEREPAPQGTDEIEYRIQTGPDQTPGPINSVASGGELSRLSLALQQSLSSEAETPVMIFDEVDAGIGGGPAEIVGQLLARLGQQVQVLCVTHLPQVAVQAQTHYCVRKHDAVRTDIEVLDQAGRIEELARMFSGVEKTHTARKHAEALLRQTHNPSSL